MVDCDRAYAAHRSLGLYNPSYSWSTKFYTMIAASLSLGGFVALIWWPWWVPVVGLFLGHMVFKSNKQSCADFVFEIIQANPEERARFMAAGIVRDDLFANVA